MCPLCIWAVLMCRRRGGLAQTTPASQLRCLRWPIAGQPYRCITSARHLALAEQQLCCALPWSRDALSIRLYWHMRYAVFLLDGAAVGLAFLLSQ